MAQDVGNAVKLFRGILRRRFSSVLVCLHPGTDAHGNGTDKSVVSLVLAWPHVVEAGLLS